MTKKKLIKLVQSYIVDGGLNYKFHDIIEGIEEFFETNVVIPKWSGSVYEHQEKKDCLEPIEAIEHMLNGGECLYLDGGTIIWDGERFKYKDQMYGWSSSSNFKYLRIKPKAVPTFEYQYAVVDNQNFAKIEWMTPMEAVVKYGNNAYVIEATPRRERNK